MPQPGVSAAPLVQSLTRAVRMPSPDRATAFAVVIALGVILRLAAFLSNRSLWLDEAMLTLNLTDRSFFELAGPLDYDQAAPLPFLWLTKLAILLFGPTEYALRSVALAASILSLPVFVFVARRLLSPLGALLGTLLFAVTPGLVLYASEVKQYSGDVFITLTILAAVLLDCKPFESGDEASAVVDPRPDWRILAVVGAAAQWCSHPALFVLAGVGLVLGLRAVYERDEGQIKRLLAVGVVWLFSFAFHYAFILKATSANDYLVHFWEDNDGFMPRGAEAAGWLVRAFVRLFEKVMFLKFADVPLGFIAGAFYLLGLVTMSRGRRTVILLFTAPLLVALAAAVVKRYPFYGRLLLFTVPLVVPVLASGLASVIEWRKTLASKAIGHPAAIFTWSPVLFLALAASLSAQRLVRPFQREESRPMVAYLQDNMKPGDGLYITYSSWPAFEYYSRRAGFDVAKSQIVVGPARHQNWSEVGEAARSLKFQRVWVLDTHSDGDAPKFLRWQFDELGVCTDRQSAEGARLMLYEMERKP